MGQAGSRPANEKPAAAPLDLASAVQSAHAAWAEDEYAKAAGLYEQILKAAGATGDAPGLLDATEHLQCHANLGSSYMMLAGERPAKPDLERRAALLSASLEHWQVAERVGPGSPLLSYFLASVKKDLGLAAQALSLQPATEDSLRVEAVERRDAKELGYDEFLERYVRAGVPVVITGAPVPAWDFQSLEERCGDTLVPRVVYDKRSAGEDWAALAAAEKVTLREHLAALSDANAPMLFDHAVAELCPDLLKELVVPRFFAVDFLRCIPEEERQGIWPAPSKFPSLFAQPAGSRCGLHVDQAGTHFYQMLLCGKKRWRLFAANEAPRLYPRGHGLLFEADAFAPDFERFPLLKGATVLEAELTPGDAIFVPQGAPHQVLNEERSLALSSNYVAGVGLEAVFAELQLLGQAGARPEYAKAAEALRRWAPKAGEALPGDPGDLPWEQFDAAAWRGQQP